MYFSSLLSLDYKILEGMFIFIAFAVFVLCISLALGFALHEGMDEEKNGNNWNFVQKG